MTPDPNLAVQLGGILATAHANDMTYQETAAMLVNALQPCIATALREARNQALEEAANLLAEQRNGAIGDKNLLMFTLAVLSNAEDKIRALKHKDGQP